MIKVHFYDYGCGRLDVEKQLGLAEEADDFLISKVNGLELEGTDNLCDMEDNQIFLFSADDEERACREIREILDALVKGETQMKYSVEMTGDML